MAFNHVTQAQDRIHLHHVIVSVYDKTGLDGLVACLLANCPGLRFYATGGSYDYLAELLADRCGAHLVRLTDYTGQPEMKGGLVKSLDWKLYLGLLAEDGDQAHQADLERYQAVRFDMVVGNLYPFGQAVAQADSLETARQHIDIGGPSMLRAAAKNFLRVASVCRPDLYDYVCAAVSSQQGCLGLEQRLWLASQSYANQAAYDQAVADYLAGTPAGSLEASYRLG